MTTRNNTAPSANSVAVAKPSAGTRLVAELSEVGDPYSLQFLIEQAGHTADYLERISALLGGDRDSWLQVKIGAKTVEVIVNNPLIQHKQFSDHLRKMIVEIHRQRGARSTPGYEDDVLNDDDD